jgi:hypothetical protein
VEGGKVQRVASLLPWSVQQKDGQLRVGGDDGRELLVGGRVTLALVLSERGEVVPDLLEVLILNLDRQWLSH